MSDITDLRSIGPHKKAGGIAHYCHTQRSVFSQISGVCIGSVLPIPERRLPVPNTTTVQILFVQQSLLCDNILLEFVTVNVLLKELGVIKCTKKTFVSNFLCAI